VVYHKEKEKEKKKQDGMRMRPHLYPHPHQHQQPQPQPQPQPLHDKKKRVETFINFDSDQFQHKVELFKTLSQCSKKRQVRPELRRFGVHPNRFYLLKQRYLLYGVWGLVDLVQNTKKGEKISPELELMIIEQRLMDPKLSPGKMIRKLDLKCSQANVQKIYNRWGLARFNQQVVLRGVISQPPPQKENIEHEHKHEQESVGVGVGVLSARKKSAKSLFPGLIQEANLKVDRLFLDLLKSLSYRSVSISNPGAIITAPFLDQLGVVEALHTYGPHTYRSTKMTNNIIVNILRNLQKLRNDASSRARELGIIEGKEIAFDYHCSSNPQLQSISRRQINHQIPG
jgi:hypothetical protein